MPGDEQVRHCGQCKQNVYNVSALTRAEAMRLLGGRACLRIYRRPDNTVITSDCRERLRAARKRGCWCSPGALLVVLWAQICAQFVGMMGLKRLIGPAAHDGRAGSGPGPGHRYRRTAGDGRAATDVPKMGEAAPAPRELPKGHRMGGRTAPPKKPSLNKGSYVSNI